ncbi:MAG: hypothetical protein F4Z26_04560 [Acidimicrobiaceae bacterium]|nr:hypothetical protein [Acidimicrobiaceae bacterium]MYE64441.1 hypothetical protein [Acidimicrobiaceae bacterium]
MTPQGWIISGGGAVVLLLAVWPAGGTRLSLGGPRLRRRWRVPAVPVTALVVGGAVFGVGFTVLHALAAAICGGVCAASLSVVADSRRWTATAEGVARLAGVLANQATVAVTVTDAVARAAPLVTGPVGEAAATLATEAETVGIDIAARRFAARVRSATAQSLADLVSVSAEGGGKWAETARVLEAEASQAAVTARLFHSRVAAALPTVALVVFLSAGLVAGVGFAAADVADWLVGTQAATLMFGGALITAALTARVILPARAIVRSGSGAR